MLKKNLCLLMLSVCFLGNTQNIKTIQLKPANNNSYAPIVSLGNVLELSFDDLDADNKEYQYKIEHMTQDWKQSDLLSNQYINGFNSNYINDVTNSFNTLQNYTHYKVTIPNENTIITKSGNYLISVFNDDDEIIFTRRCVFYEKSTTVGVSVVRGRNLKDINQQQTVQFLIDHSNLPINNPFQELNATVIQNNNWNTAITNLKPQFTRPNQLIFNYIKETNFYGGNEFLNFDSKNIRNSNLNIARVDLKDVFHHYLYTNEIRKNKLYTYAPDINGEFVVRSLESEEPDTEADYASTHFSLEAETPFKDKEIYVYGNFNNYSFSEENKMTYNTKDNIYEVIIPFKQGFYNYNFATIDNNNKINLTEIDGSFYETENGFFDQNR